MCTAKYAVGAGGHAACYAGVLLPNGTCCTTGSVSSFPADTPACCESGALDACGGCAVISRDAAAPERRVLGLDATGACCVVDDASGFLTGTRQCCHSSALVDDCGVCGGDGSSCTRRVLGTLALPVFGRDRSARFEDLLREQLPGATVTAVTPAAARELRSLRLHPAAGLPPGLRDRDPTAKPAPMDGLAPLQRSDPARSFATASVVHASQKGYGWRRDAGGRSVGQAFGEAARSTQRRHSSLEWLPGARRSVLEWSEEPVMKAVVFSVSGVAGGATVYGSVELAAAFVAASAAAVAEGVLARESAPPVVSVRGEPGNGVCEAGETEANSAGDCSAAVLCRTPARVGVGKPCGGNGACDAGSGTCVCARGYTGLDCGACDASRGYVEQEVTAAAGVVVTLCSVVAADVLARMEPPDRPGGNETSSVPDGGSGWRWSRRSVWFCAAAMAGGAVLILLGFICCRRWWRAGACRPRAVRGQPAGGAPAEHPQGAVGGDGGSSGGGVAGGSDGAAAVVDGLEGYVREGPAGGSGGWGWPGIYRTSAKAAQVQPIGDPSLAVRDERFVFGDDPWVGR